MVAKTLVLSIALMLIVTQAPAADYSATTHFYSIEYMKPTSAGGVSILNVVFNRQLAATSAERTLGEEIQRAVALFPPDNDVMAYAWTETNPEPSSEKMITLPDGSTFLIYSHKTKQIQTEKQYSAAKLKRPETGKQLKVEVSLDLERGPDGRVRILGKTNLPDGMKLMLGLRGSASNYSAQDSVEVQNGRIISMWFSEKERPLRSGTYEITISSPLPDLQPLAVRGVIGKNGENLVGPVKSWMGSKMVELSLKKTLP